MVTADEQFVVLLISTLYDLLVTHAALDKPLWGFSGQAFRSHFNSYLRRFKIEHLGFQGAQRG